MTTNYEKGRQLEEKVVKFLQWHGFIAVASRGSHGDWDIVAIPHQKHDSRKTLLIQAGPKTPEELNRLYHNSIEYQENSIFFHLKKKYKQSPQVKLLQMHRTIYITIEEMLRDFYGVSNILPFFKAVKSREEIERKLRQEKKLK